jgi:hypothetical protein
MCEVPHSTELCKTISRFDRLAVGCAVGPDVVNSVFRGDIEIA